MTLRPPVDDPAVRALVGERKAIDVGGTTSLNLHLPEDGLVLRVHNIKTSRARIDALRHLRRCLDDAGLVVGLPVGDVVRCGGWWAESERYVAHEQPPATWASYTWMYRSMGALHRVLTPIDVTVPLPGHSTYGPPSSLRRWLRVTERFVDVIEVRALARRLDRQWVTGLPASVIHGDVRLGNVATTPDGDAVYLDFGFAARRPRVHELAYSLAWIVLRPDSSGTAAAFDWSTVGDLLAAYEEGAQQRLTDEEVAAIDPYLAAVPLYLAAVAGFTSDPVATFAGGQHFLGIADWVLENRPCARLRR
jgi:hypothetical protein